MAVFSEERESSGSGTEEQDLLFPSKPNDIEGL